MGLSDFLLSKSYQGMLSIAEILIKHHTISSLKTLTQLILAFEISWIKDSSNERNKLTR